MLPSACITQPLDFKKLLKQLKDHYAMPEAEYKKALKLLKLYPDKFYLDAFVCEDLQIKPSKIIRTRINYGVKVTMSIIH